MSFMDKEYHEVYEMSRKHCKILKTLNREKRLHIGLTGYNRILNSKLYNKVRHNKSFD